MSDDRRKTPRYPCLIHGAVIFGREKRDVFCTQVGPTAGFLSGRPDGLAPGMIVAVELRAGGLAVPAMLLQAEVVRLVHPGGAWPVGFAVRWKSISSELGVMPLLDFVGSVLRLPNVTNNDVTAGRHAELDLESFAAGKPAQVREVTRTSGLYAADPRVLAGQRAARASQMVPTAGLLSALGHGNMTPARGSASASSWASKGRAEHADDMAPIMVREPTNPSWSGGLRRAGGMPRSGTPVLKVQHAGGPVMDGVERKDATAAPELGNLHAPAPETPPPPPAADPQRAVLPAGAPPFAAPTPAQAPSLAPRSGPSGNMAAEKSPDSPVAPPAQPPVAAAAAESAPREPARQLSKSDPFDPNHMPVLAEVAKRRHADPDSIALAKPPKVKSGPALLDSDRQGLDASQLVSGPLDPPSRVPMSDDFSQSWPVYALAPGERRTEPGDNEPQIPALIAAGERFTLEGEKTETQPKPGPITDNLGAAPAEVPDLAVMNKRSARNDHGRRMVAATIPVSFDYLGQSGRGLVISMSMQAVAVVTNGEAPELDVPVVLHLPLVDKGAPMIVHLCGKLLQIMTETDQGPRFVLHIERIEEGQNKGAYERALAALSGD